MSLNLARWRASLAGALPRLCGRLGPRPLLHLSIGLALGALVGLSVRETWSAWAAPRLALEAAAALGALALPGFCRKRGLERIGWILAVFGLGLLHGSRSAGSRTAPEVPASPERQEALVLAAREGTLAGRWRPLGDSNRGWVQPVAGVPTAAHSERLLLHCEQRAPPPGAWVLVLPGTEAVALPRGPVPGPRRRNGAFLAESRVRPDELVIFDGPPTGWCRSLLSALREPLRQARDRLSRRALGLESEGAAHGLVAALLLGDRSRVSGATLDLFTRTGTRHMLALSGLHVGLVAGALLLPLTGCLMWLPVRGRGRQHLRRVVMGLRLGLLVAYVLAAGFADPVTRAGAALAVVTLAPFVRARGPSRSESGGNLGRTPDALSVWGAVLLLETLVEPAALRSVSLRLSYLATMGILVGTRPVMQLLSAPLARFGTAGALRARLGMSRAGPRLLLEVVAGRLARFLLSGFAASIAAVCATLPEVATRFGEWSPVGILATPLLVPGLTLLLVCGWIGMLAPLPLIEQLPALLAEGMLAGLRWIDALPGTPMVLPPRPAWLLYALCLAGFAILVGALRAPRLIRGIRLVAALVVVPWCPSPAGLELHALDVGHGTCVVVRAPGLEALVFDAGSSDRHRIHGEALGPLLARWEVKRPWVALSHDDRDHSSGLWRLVERTPPRGWIGALPEELGARLPTDTLRLDPGPGRTSLRLGSLELGIVRGALLPGNEGSRFVELRWRDQRILLSGDAEAEGLEPALAHAWLHGPLRLLLFPHHGSDTPLSGRLLEDLDPGEVWVSVGRPPPIGTELNRRGIPWRTTERDGPLALQVP